MRTLSPNIPKGKTMKNALSRVKSLAKRRDVQLTLAASTGALASYLYHVQYKDSLLFTKEDAMILNNDYASLSYKTKHGTFILVSEDVMSRKK
jgi:hypothetical protein